jgi:hypothetical protein
MAWQAMTLDTTSVMLLLMMSLPIQDSLEKLLLSSYFKNGASLPYVVPVTAGPTHGVASHYPGLDRRERHQFFSNVALNDVAPNMAFLRKIIVVIIHGYFKNGPSLPTNVVPSTAGPTHDMASRDPELNRSKQSQSFSNILKMPIG